MVDVQSSGIEVTTPFQNFEDYWRPFVGGQGPAPAYVASLDVPRAFAHTARRADRAEGPGGRRAA